MRARCKSAWLLHFAAALRPFGSGNLTTEQCVQERHIVCAVGGSVERRLAAKKGQPVISCYRVGAETPNTFSKSVSPRSSRATEVRGQVGEGGLDRALEAACHTSP
jgi:hypothetical protein